jgi:hypothetical protein
MRRPDDDLVVCSGIEQKDTKGTKRRLMFERQRSLRFLGDLLFKRIGDYVV